MTRFARAKSSHQRIEDSSTPWTDLKKTQPKPQRHNSGRDKFKNKRHEESANFTALGDGARGSGKNPNVRGEGGSKSVKIFGSFWVGEEDARRLQTLAKKMKDEGVGRKDILKALQVERRKAEKANKRRRDKTCFNCRQFGHILADCPSAGSSGIGIASSQGDICFKCGSTEHTSRTCKRKNDKFSFAKCFVCSQSGHIARQCPTNSKGIYPAGGCCDECGSVAHLKKDCPDLLGQDTTADNEGDVKLGRVDNPFVSTEYQEEHEDDAMEVDDDQVTSSHTAKKSKLKRKLSLLDSKIETPPIKNVESKPTAPKKRRVKF